MKMLRFGLEYNPIRPLYTLRRIEKVKVSAGRPWKPLNLVEQNIFVYVQNYFLMKKMRLGGNNIWFIMFHHSTTAKHWRAESYYCSQFATEACWNQWQLSSRMDSWHLIINCTSQTFKHCSLTLHKQRIRKRSKHKLNIYSCNCYFNEFPFWCGFSWLIIDIFIDTLQACLSACLRSANVNSLDFYAVGRLLGKGAFGKAGCRSSFFDTDPEACQRWSRCILN